jgi:hypothetical protein
MEKLLVHLAAASLTQAACGTIGGNLVVSADLQDPGVRAKNLQVWETQRVFYHAIVNSLANDDPQTGWPAPQLDLAGLTTALGPLFAAGSPLAALLQKVTSVIVNPAPAVGVKLPNPGDAKVGS